MHMQTSKRAAAGAGAALGFAMATAAEGVPLVVAGLGIAGLVWLTRPTVFAQGLRWFGAGLAATSAVMLPVVVPLVDTSLRRSQPPWVSKRLEKTPR